MQDPDYRRAIQIAVIFGMVSLVCIVILTFVISLRLRSFNDQIQTATVSLQGRIGVLKNGADGKPGLSLQGIKGDKGDKGDMGVQGQNGINGQNAVSVNTVQPVVTNVPVQGDKGDKGDPGETGAPGRAVFLRSNPDTGAQECEYAGTENWLPANECQ